MLSLTDANALTVQFYHLPAHVVRHWERTNGYRLRHATRQDAVADGMLILIRASRAFDPDRGTKFSTYAYTAIWRYLAGFLGSNRVVTVPAGTVSNRNKLSPKGRATVLAALKRKTGGLTDVLLTTLPDNSTDLRELVVAREEHDRLRQAMSQLSHDDRDILRRRFWDHLTVAEIGNRRGISKELARIHVHKALARLRRVFLRLNLDAEEMKRIWRLPVEWKGVKP